MKRWMVRHFLAGVLALWALWFGLGIVVAELRQRSTAAHAEGVLRRIPFWTNYEETVGKAKRPKERNGHH